MGAMREIRWGLMPAIMAAAIAFAAMPAAARDYFPTAYAQPAMPLTEALRHFARATGNDVVFREEMVKGIAARAVRDAQDPYDALRQMLAGSGLSARFTRRDAFILEPEGQASKSDLALDRIEILALNPAERRFAYRWYGEKLLEACLDTLRRSGQMGRRSYDFTIYVWLSEDGEVVDLAGGKPADGHDEALATAREVLRGLAVGSIPPADMPQPVGLRIVAR